MGKKRPHTSVHWTPEEINFLYSHAGSKPLGYIAARLEGRTKMAIWHKCRSLGLDTIPTDDFWTTGTLAKMLDCTSSALNKRINKGDLKVKKTRGKYSYITRGNFREFYQKYKRARLFKGVDPEILEWILLE